MHRFFTMLTFELKDGSGSFDDFGNYLQMLGMIE